MSPIEQAFEEFGDPHAVNFSKALFRFIHLLDDLVDRDKTLPSEGIVLTLLAFIDQLSSNAFWQQHKHDLFPVLHCSAMAWAASERLRKSEDVQQRLAAEVLKSEYQNVFFRIAFLVGGAEFAYNWELKYRGYTFG
jgi:hypothetical protein